MVGWIRTTLASLGMAAMLSDARTGRNRTRRTPIVSASSPRMALTQRFWGCLPVMLTLVAGCGSTVVDPTPTTGLTVEDTASLAVEIRQHLTDCPCGRVRITVWKHGTLVAEKTFTRRWLDDACQPVTR